ncbi:MAG: hypothetical protein ABIK62_08135 [candidate division WOR-3 bacterium]
MLLPALAGAGIVVTEINLTGSDLSVEHVGEYDLIRVRGCSFLSDPGTPLLPVKVVVLAVPPDAQVDSVTAIGLDSVVITGLQTLFPAQLPRPLSATDSVPFMAPDPASYGRKLVP